MKPQEFVLWLQGYLQAVNNYYSVRDVKETIEAKIKEIKIEELPTVIQPLSQIKQDGSVPTTVTTTYPNEPYTITYKPEEKNCTCGKKKKTMLHD